MKEVQNSKCRIQDIINCALQEDIGSGDITSRAVIPADSLSKARIIAKDLGIICGLDIADWVFKTIDKKIKFVKKIRDGSSVRAGAVIAIVEGPTRPILSAERTALNFLQRLSGIATLTEKFVKAAGRKVKVLDTRKTTPAIRMLEKYAVRTGGGTNHRFGLFDAILIKDNHIAAAGSLKKTVSIARKKYQKVEVETKTFAQVKEAIEAGATRIMLDNMSISGIKAATKLIRSSKRKIEIEVSGGINLGNISKIAKTGIDYISIGALTHSAPAMDISLKVI